MQTAVVIPARYASTRLPGKPLLCDTGKPLIQHVYERATALSDALVLVATDDYRIADSVRSFGGNVVMTRPDHPSGTDRVAEVAGKLDAEIILNVQGDEPLIDPVHLHTLRRMLTERSVEMATLAVPIADEREYLNPNQVKVVCDQRGRALYFSRSPIPYVRDGQPDFTNGCFLRHVGTYAYRREFLLRLAATPPHPLEEIEKLEQLRALALGAAISVSTVDHAHAGIDTPEDYAAFVRWWRTRAA